MPTMRVKDLIAALQTLDPELPIHKHAGIGNFTPIDIDYAGHWAQRMTLMQSKTDKTYFADTKDSMWSKMTKKFRKPFEAVVFW